MSLTPYAAARIVNDAFKAHDCAKTIPTQMMYNYTTARINAHKAPFIECDDQGRITEEGLNKWMKKYFTKKGIELTEDDLVEVSK